MGQNRSEDNLSEAAQRHDALEMRLLTKQANGTMTEQEEESITDAMDRLWLDMSDAEQDQVDVRASRDIEKKT